MAASSGVAPYCETEGPVLSRPVATNEYEAAAYRLRAVPVDVNVRVLDEVLDSLHVASLARLEELLRLLGNHSVRTHRTVL
jgi:hypothetical protein